MTAVIRKIWNWIKLDDSDIGCSMFNITADDEAQLVESRKYLEKLGEKYRDGLIPYEELYETWKADVALNTRIWNKISVF